jgi:hypothetical protein
LKNNTTEETIVAAEELTVEILNRLSKDLAQQA